MTRIRRRYYCRRRWAGRRQKQARATAWAHKGCSVLSRGPFRVLAHSLARWVLAGAGAWFAVCCVWCWLWAAPACATAARPTIAHSPPSIPSLRHNFRVPSATSSIAAAAVRHGLLLRRIAPPIDPHSDQSTCPAVFAVLPVSAPRRKRPSSARVKAQDLLGAPLNPVHPLRQRASKIAPRPARNARGHCT